MGNAISFIQGAGVGAGLMYFFDPDLGRRRRALLRDQLVHLMHEVDRGTAAALDDAGHRVRGMAAEMRSPESENVDDIVLVERVRARIGRINSHPGAIFVTADNGQVTLSGPVLADEVERLLDGVRSVPGVKGAVNHLEVHEHPGDVPGLQGESHLAGTHSFVDATWDPSVRLLVGALGSGMLGYGLGRRGVVGLMSDGFGVILLARAISNLPFQQLFGVDAGRGAIEYQKIININAPLDEVFRLWTNVELFPRFMQHVLEASVVGPGRTSWTIRGPLGMPIHFEAETTTYVPDEEVAWKSIDGATIPNEGIVRFRTNPDGSTRVNIRMSYTPPMGFFGNLLAAFMGDDPKQLMDDDLTRFKSLLENGKTRVHHHTVELSQLNLRPKEAGEVVHTPTQS